MRQLKGPILLLAVPLAFPLAAQGETVEQNYGELSSLVSQHQYARADRLLSQILASSNDRAATYFRAGKIYFDHEAWQRSATFLEQSLRLNRANDQAHQLLGLDCRELHQPDKAEIELLEAAKENPSNKSSVYFAGQQLLLNGKVEAALPYLYTALDSEPLKFQALQALGLTQARLGNYALAESYFRKVVDADQTSETDLYSALVNLSLLLLLGHDPAGLEEGLLCARRAEKLQPASPEAYFLAGKALFKLARFAEANQELKQAATLNPKDSKPHFLLAQIYDRLGQNDHAQKERNEVTRLQAQQGQTGMATADPLPVGPENLSDKLHR
jgi:tetratricopeptide (TPR) repeat protein